jgi:hypothetical protein
MAARSLSGRIAGRVAWLHYPLGMIAAFAVFAALRHAGAPLVISTYLPVLLAAGAITLLELAFRHRPEWRPRRPVR